jgi:putative PIN family toxin of toxin-antitoxin system
MRLVLDTNIWLDWLVFADPGVAALRRAHERGEVEIAIDEACEAELVRVLGYELHARVRTPEEQAAALAACRAIARRFPWPASTPASAPAPAVKLPQCRDPDDQKFLVLALACGAQALLTKDNALLELERGVLPFRIMLPRELKFS